MAVIHNKALDKTMSVGRILNKVVGDNEGPTVVFFAGIHGNETAGVFALEEALKEVAMNNQKIKGTVYGVSGNLKALETNKRFIDEDLNRMWSSHKLDSLEDKENLLTEEEEQAEVLAIIRDILMNEKAPFYFIDLHTTSSKTIPFITINDATINRKFSKLFPVPIVLGIEEHLTGPLLSYINELGFVSLGFESGQHDEKEAVDNARAFIHLALLYSGITSVKNFPEPIIFHEQLKNATQGLKDIFEVIDLYRIHEKNGFRMQPGFESFQEIKKGTILATNDSTPIAAKYNARVFMPLYQSEGMEGFFLIKQIKPVYLKASLLLRNLKLDNLLALLPGVKWEDGSKKALIANLKVAKYLAKPIFHLLGYRNRQVNEDHVRLHNRERASQLHMYRDEFWFKGD